MDRKPSDILAEALKHLQLCEEQGILVDMSCWVENYKNHCWVCLGGAVLVQKYGVKDDCGPQTAPTGVNLKELYFLNAIRQGLILGAFRALDRELPESLSPSADIDHYEKSREGFYRDMWHLVEVLQEHGE